MCHIQSIFMFKLKACLVGVCLLYGCGGAEIEKIESCVPETYIFSTDDIWFYLVKAGSHYNRYPYLGSKGENFLCFYDQRSFDSDQCGYNVYGKLEVYRLVPGTHIFFDGLAIKTAKWNIAAIETKLEPITWFRGKILDETIWVNSHQLMWLFESESSFKENNMDAYEKLSMERRMPPPLLSVTNELVSENLKKYRNDIIEAKIANWNCRLPK